MITVHWNVSWSVRVVKPVPPKWRRRTVIVRRTGRNYLCVVARLCSFSFNLWDQLPTGLLLPSSFCCRRTQPICSLLASFSSAYWLVLLGKISIYGLISSSFSDGTVGMFFLSKDHTFWKESSLGFLEGSCEALKVQHKLHKDVIKSCMERSIVCIDGYSCFTRASPLCGSISKRPGRIPGQHLVMISARNLHFFNLIVAAVVYTSRVTWWTWLMWS